MIFTLYLYVDDVMPEQESEKSKIITALWKAIDREKLDHSILHLLVTTIFKYLATWKSNSDETEVIHQV